MEQHIEENYANNTNDNDLREKDKADYVGYDNNNIDNAEE